MKTIRLLTTSAFTLGIALGGASLARADDKDKPDDETTKEAAALDAAAAAQGDTEVTAQIADKFAKFAGSSTNAIALVNGLHDGTAITLSTSAGTTTSFKPATGSMGFGNVMIALSLAREDLAKQGIKSPTSEQLQAALNGGSVTTGTGTSAKTTQLPGVLALRQSGQGWGQIAQQLDVKLGRAMSDLHSEVKRAEKSAEKQNLGMTGRPTTAEKPERPDKPERAERPERPERPERGPGGR